MEKKVLSLLLAVVLVVGLFSGLGIPVRAANLTISADAIAMIKKFEGFVKYPMWDNTQWTVGYGTRCPDDKLEEYRKNGITEEEAEALLDQFLTSFSYSVNQFAGKYGLNLSQAQFDALVSLTFNCGPGWTIETGGILNNAIRSRASGNDLIYAFSLWSKSGGVGLINRRLAEANLYLNGSYSTKKPSNYTYVFFDGNGGSVNYDIQGYDKNTAASIMAKVDSRITLSGKTYTFDGWYTAASGGSKVEKLDGSLSEGAKLYAHWKSDGGEVAKPPALDTTPVNREVTVTGDGVNVRTGPGVSYPVSYSIPKGTKITVTEFYKDSGGLPWGRFTWQGKDGWICLNYTDYDKVSSGTVYGVVTVGDYLNIRSGPGTGYSVVGSYPGGTRIAILEQKKAGSDTWGRTDKGWVNMAYVKLESGESTPTQPTQPPTTVPPTTVKPTQPPTTVPPTTKPTQPTQPTTKPTEAPTSPTTPTDPNYKAWKGIVTASDILRVRKGPGTNYTVVSYLKSGAEVTILNETTVDGERWGKIDKGWISLQYVKKADAQTTDKPEEKPTEPPKPQGEPTKPEVKPTKPEAEGKWTGTVSAKETLLIREEAGRFGKPVGVYQKGDKIGIQEIVTLGSKHWGKTEHGWVCMDFVTLPEGAKLPPESTAQIPAANQVLEAPLTLIVNSCSLRIRQKAEFGGRILDFAAMGDALIILETLETGTARWGRTEAGWVDMTYLKQM